MDKKRSNLSIREIALFGLLGSLTFGAKMAMMALPNIEPVSLFVMLFTVTFGRKAIFPIYVYVLLEFLFWPMGLWSLNYLYIWLILAAAAFLLRGVTAPLAWAALSGAFGLLFGLLSVPAQLLVGGPSFALAWWISGIPYDIVHCVGNFFIALFLFQPLRKLLLQLYRQL